MNDKLKQWAYSFSGCDGGDLEADTWLCGIEWGYSGVSEEEKRKYYTCELPNEIEEGEVELDSTYNFFTDESFSYPFNRGFAKIYAALKGYKAEEYREIKGRLLKLNMSPIGFWKDREELWEKYNLPDTTGFETKEQFLKFLNELNRFAEIREKYKPKLIVCVGVGRRRDFLKCFFGNANNSYSKRILNPRSEKNSNIRNIYYTRYDSTLLVVVPFFTSPNGLNSDYLLEETGNVISELLKNV